LKSAATTLNIQLISAPPPEAAPQPQGKQQQQRNAPSNPEKQKARPAQRSGECVTIAGVPAHPWLALVSLGAFPR